MSRLTEHQIDAVRRVGEAFGQADAHEVELGVPHGFAGHQVLAHLAGSVFRDVRVLMVVAHPSLIPRAFESGIADGHGRRIGLVSSDSDVEVASLPAAVRLARDGRIGHGAVLLDGLRPDQDEQARELVRGLGHAQVLHLRDEFPLDAGPEGFAFPVRVVSSREAGHSGPAPP